MMELGNLFFGNSRGRFQVPREDAWYEPLIELFAAYAPDRDNGWREYGEAFENDVFRVFPYYWGGCTCGYEALAEAWATANKHAPSCYQTYLSSKLEAYDDVIGEERHTNLLDGFDNEVSEDPLVGVTVIVSTPKPRKSKVSYEERERARTKIQREACQKFNIPWNKGYGCMCHCTCTHDADWKKWSASHDHKTDCTIVIPNFHYKPNDFQLNWYKYPLRDSYMNQDITAKQFRAIIDRCIASLTPHP